MGSYLDVVWRLMNGQRLYMDFIFPEGPIHVNLMLVFCRLLGLGKTALWAHVVIIHSMVIILIFLLLYRRTSLGITLAVTLLTVPSFYWPFSFPWHDQTAHFWGILAVFLLA